MPNVWVTQENPSFNYLPAEEYGEVNFITAQDFSPMANSLTNVAVINSIRDALTRFNADEDFILPSGSPVVSAAVFMAVGRITKKARVLKWSNRDQNYIPITGIPSFLNLSARAPNPSPTISITTQSGFG